MNLYMLTWQTEGGMCVRLSAVEEYAKAYGASLGNPTATVHLAPLHDAPLLDAAPALLAAREGLLAWSDSLTCPPADARPHPSHGAARAAIAAAKGEA